MEEIRGRIVTEIVSLLCFFGMRVLGVVRRFAGRLVSLPVVEEAGGVAPTRSAVVDCTRLCCCCCTWDCCVPPLLIIGEEGSVLGNCVEDGTGLVFWL